MTAVACEEPGEREPALANKYSASCNENEQVEEKAKEPLALAD